MFATRSRAAAAAANGGGGGESIADDTREERGKSGSVFCVVGQYSMVAAAASPRKRALLVASLY